MNIGNKTIGIIAPICFFSSTKVPARIPNMDPFTYPPIRKKAIYQKNYSTESLFRSLMK